ncbi:MAG TPA: hypothetical protein VGC67_01285 [Cellulomonas sp.]
MTPTPPDGPGAGGPQDADDLGFEIPDDLSGLDALVGTAPRAGVAPAGPPAAPDPGPAPEPDPGAGVEASDEPVVALLVTQVATALPLAAACALAGVAADVVPSPIGALAVLRDVDQAAGTARAAGDLSRILRISPVILLDRRAGRIAASRWLGGAQEDELAPGLVLSGAPEVLEDLLLGGTPVADLDGVQTSVGMSRWTAMRALAGKRPKRG